MRISRDLGYTLSDLTQRITREEVQLWAALYEVEFQEEEESIKKARRR
jgi:hypothetical protein